MNILSEIWSSISQNRFRTAMTGFAVAWGIFILVVLLGASNGLQNGIEEGYGNRLQNAVDIWAGWTSKPYQGLKTDRPLHFTNKEADILRKLPEVELFSVVANTNDITANYGVQYVSVTVKGVESDYQDIFRKTIYKGRFLNAYDEQEHAKVCVIDKRCTEELATEDMLGRYLKLGDINFLVVGICENGDQWEGVTVHIPLSTHQSIYSHDHHFSNISLTLNEDAIKKTLRNQTGPRRRGQRESSEFETKVRELLSPSMQFDPTDQRAVGVWSQQERYEETQKVMSAIRLFVLIIGICTLISGAVGVSNIMLVSVRERTKEFGIRKAIGAPPSTILKTVVGESVLITALFGYIGMFAGIGIMELINKMLPPGGDFPFRDPTVDIPAVTIATLILVLVGVVAGAIPAVRAMRIKPIEALNYEK